MTAPMVRRYRKRPVTVDAMRWYWGGDTGHAYETVRDRLFEWVAAGQGAIISPEGTWHDPIPKGPLGRDLLGPKRQPTVTVDPYTLRLYIKTPEGIMEALPGDWIVRGVIGEFYPVMADVFTATYEPAGHRPDPE